MKTSEVLQQTLLLLFYGWEVCFQINLLSYLELDQGSGDDRIQCYVTRLQERKARLRSY
jgi:hypothetical protein